MIINLEYETRLKLSIKMIPSLIYAAPRTKTCYACGRAMHGKSMFARICTYRCLISKMFCAVRKEENRKWTTLISDGGPYILESDIQNNVVTCLKWGIMTKIINCF